jgi:hypothetical protein
VKEVKNYVNETKDNGLKQAYTTATRALNSTSATTVSSAYIALTEAVANYKQSQLRLAQNGQPADLTCLITNSSFTRYNVGWQGADLSVAYNAYANETAEQFSRPFDIWQEITGLPAGVYTIRCKAFYRAGSISAGYQAWQDNATSTRNAQLYANDVATPLPNLFSSSTYTYNPYTYPDNLTQASAALNDANAYTPVSVSIKIDEGETLRLGIRKQSTISADWVAYDNFQLFYVENLTDVKNISVEHTSDDVYDIQGRHVRKNSNLTGIPKGVYIINGNKIMVK